MAHEETNISNRWRKKWAKFAILFRTQVGMAWTGKVVNQWNDKGVTYVTLSKARIMSMGGVKGMSDLTGWRSVTITPDMVGQRVAIYTAVEVKTPKGKISPDQKRFTKNVNDAGGIGIVIRSEDDDPELLSHSDS